jgi:E3 ubiquitin-protein ligase RBBP6
MAVYYRYKSGVETFSVPVQAPFVSVAELKGLILGTARHGHGRTRGRGPREGIALSDPRTGDEYSDGTALVPRGSTVLVRRVAGPPAEAITVAAVSSPPPPKATAPADVGGASSSTLTLSSSAEDDDEARAIDAVIDAARLEWGDRHRSQLGQRRYGHRGAALQGAPAPAPPAGYVCHRCRVPGHFIQHCPTNGDPRYDIRAQAPSVSSTSLLPTPAPASATPDDGVPPELHCKICSEVMADAAVASRCCFGSFCDACIRGRITVGSTCVCGAPSRADDLIPNLTLRATIAKLLATRDTGSGSSGADNRKSSAGSNAAEPTPSPGAAASQDSRSSHVTVTACSERSDGSASSTSKSAAAPVAREARTKQISAAASAEIGGAPAGYPEQYGYGNPFGPPTCYDPFFGTTPWACGPYMYYGVPYGGGYTDVPAPAGYNGGYHRRKRTADEEYHRHVEADGIKRRCRGRSEVAF